MDFKGRMSLRSVSYEALGISSHGMSKAPDPNSGSTLKISQRKEGQGRNAQQSLPSTRYQPRKLRHWPSSRLH